MCTQSQGGHSLLSLQDTAEELFFQIFFSSCTQESLLGGLGRWALSTQDGIAGTGKTLTHSSRVLSRSLRSTPLQSRLPRNGQGPSPGEKRGVVVSGFFPELLPPLKVFKTEGDPQKTPLSPSTHLPKCLSTWWHSPECRGLMWGCATTHKVHCLVMKKTLPKQKHQPKPDSLWIMLPTLTP